MIVLCAVCRLQPDRIGCTGTCWDLKTGQAKPMPPEAGTV